MGESKRIDRLVEHLRKRVYQCDRDVPKDQDAATPIYEMCRCIACQSDRALLATIAEERAIKAATGGEQNG